VHDDQPKEFGAFRRPLKANATLYAAIRKPHQFNCGCTGMHPMEAREIYMAELYGTEKVSSHYFTGKACKYDNEFYSGAPLKCGVHRTHEILHQLKGSWRSTEYVISRSGKRCPRRLHGKLGSIHSWIVVSTGMSGYAIDMYGLLW